MHRSVPPILTHALLRIAAILLALRTYRHFVTRRAYTRKALWLAFRLRWHPSSGVSAFRTIFADGKRRLFNDFDVRRKVITAETLTPIFAALCDAAEASADVQPNLSSACDACLLMLLDASHEDGVHVDVQVVGLSSYGVVDEG